MSEIFRFLTFLFYQLSKLCNLMFYSSFISERIVDILGRDLPIKLFKETQKIEKDGGMMIMVCLKCDRIIQNISHKKYVLEWSTSSNTWRSISVFIEAFEWNSTRSKEINFHWRYTKNKSRKKVVTIHETGSWSWRIKEIIKKRKWTNCIVHQKRIAFECRGSGKL